jgi:GTP-binding protein
VVRDPESGAVIKDMSDSQPFILAKGGRGGWGNKRFATPTRQVPRFAKPGLHGESRQVILELKLLADVGLVGFPNVGKSTLLAAASNARPKIANYHFTTLYPNLGVVYADEGASFVMADIPGIIEGASQGAGLGYDFLRHIDRCRLLVHLVDISGCEGRDPAEDFKAINAELAGYSEALSKRPQIVVGNKADIAADHTPADNLKKLAEELGFDYYEISAATGNNVRNLIRKIWEKLSTLPPITVYETQYVAPLPVAGLVEDVDIQVEDGNTYILSGQWLDRLVSSTNFGDYESRMHFDRQLRECGIFERLESMGIKDGDTVSIYDLEFEYMK